jgi:hypothetical protein
MRDRKPSAKGTAPEEADQPDNQPKKELSNPSDRAPNKRNREPQKPQYKPQVSNDVCTPSAQPP